MSQKDKAKWEAMLDADPKLRAAWHGFAKQLAHDAAFLKLGVQPTGEAIGKAAQMVEDAANPQDD